MRDHSKISGRFWQRGTGTFIKQGGAECTVVALYLMTSPHANALGCYYLPLEYLAVDTGLPLEGASKGLQRCVEGGFCAYDEATQYVWVRTMAAYQVASELKANDNRTGMLAEQFLDIPDGCPHIKPLYDTYKARFHLPEHPYLSTTCAESSLSGQPPSEAPPKPLPSPSEAPSKPESREQRAESREQRAESREQNAPACPQPHPSEAPGHSAGSPRPESGDPCEAPGQNPATLAKPPAIPSEAPLPNLAEATQCGALSALLCGLGVKSTPGLPQVVEWVRASITHAEAEEAVRRARINKPPPEAIPARYLAPIVAEVLGERGGVPKARASPGKAGGYERGNAAAIEESKRLFHERQARVN